MASIQQRKAECPLCRRPFPASECQLVVNHELRRLLSLAAALGTVEHENGWQAITTNQVSNQFLPMFDYSTVHMTT